MKFSESLKKTRDFQFVYRNGKSMANHQLVMYVADRGMQGNRLGLSVSKKVGNSVVRHHLMRLLRESYRLHEEEFVEGKDIVVVVRPSAKECTFFEIERALLHLARKHKILRTEKNEKNTD